MSELQPDNGIVFDESDVQEPQGAEPQIIEEQEPETEDQPDNPDDSASATDDTDKDQAVKFDEKQQEKVNELIAEKVKKQREAERKAEKLERELQELKAKLPEETKPVIPPLPDPFSLSETEYRAKIAEREEAIRRSAAYEARQESLQKQTQEARQQAENARLEAQMRKVQSYSQRAVQLGITADELQVAGNTVAQFGMDDSLVELILDDKDGPLITKYLSKNIAELEALRSLPPAYAAVRIATDIKQKASALKPKVNPAPDPVRSPRQSGSTQRQFGPKGATYE